MSKLVVAVKSCQRDRNLGFHDAIRETWGRDLKKMGVDVKFFIGHNGNPIKGHVEFNGRQSITLQSDETMVDSLDDYNSLPHKTRGICKWSVDRMFKHLFLCDCDTIINAKALTGLPYEIFDYAGHFRGGQAEIGQTFYYKDHMGEYPNCYPWASGGIGYFISKQAAMLIADTFPKIWAEDMFVGQVLGPQIQNGTYLGGALSLSGIATWHFRKSKMYPDFTPALLRRIHKEGTVENVYEESHHA